MEAKSWGSLIPCPRIRITKDANPSLSESCGRSDGDCIILYPQELGSAADAQLELSDRDEAVSQKYCLLEWRQYRCRMPLPLWNGQIEARNMDYRAHRAAHRGVHRG